MGREGTDEWMCAEAAEVLGDRRAEHCEVLAGRVLENGRRQRGERQEERLEKRQRAALEPEGRRGASHELELESESDSEPQKRACTYNWNRKNGATENTQSRAASNTARKKRIPRLKNT